MKIMKLSLAAAILVSGVSVLNAQSLENAIKNVDVSGTANVRYNDYQNSSTTNYYKIATSIKSQIGEDVNFNSRIIVGKDTAPISFGSNSSDDEIALELSELNLGYKGINNTLITLGKDAIDTPFTIKRSASGDEQVGTGISLITKLENTTFSAGYYNQTNFDKSGNVKSLFTNNPGSDFSFASIKTSLGTITLDAAYAKAQDVLDTYTVGIKSKNKFSDVQLTTFARYSALDKDSDNNKNSLWKVGAKIKSGIFGAFVAYGETNKEGGTVGIDEGSDVGFDEHWSVTLTGTNDASTLYASVNAQVLPKLNLALKYSDLKVGNNSTGKDQKEIYAQALYKLYPNLKSYVRFGQYEKDGLEDATRGRVNIEYSF